MEPTGYIHIVPVSKSEKAHTIKFSGPTTEVLAAVSSIPAMQQEIERLRAVASRLQADNERLLSACRIGLPFAKGDAADVLRATIAHAKGEG